MYYHCEEPYENCQIAATQPPDDNIENGGGDRNRETEVIKQPGIWVYSNPFTGAVRIDFNDGEPILSGLVLVEFRDITGRIVATFQNDAAGKGTFSMEMDLGRSAVPPGTYTMSVKSETGVFASFLLIKMK